MTPFIALILLIAAETLGDPAPETIAVNITVKTEAGVPIENAPIMAFVQAPLVFGFTDAQGELILHAPLSGKSEEVIAALYMGGVTLTPEDRALAEQRYFQLLDQYYFAKFESVLYTAGMTKVDIDVTAYDAVKITGTVTSPLPTWASDMVRIGVRGGAWFKNFLPLQPFEVRGVQKGQPVELFFLLYEENAYRSVRLTAEQTKADVAIGEIQFPDIASGAAVDISVNNMKDLWEPGGLHPMWIHVTLISMDGETILCYPIAHALGKVVERVDILEEGYGLPSIPPGIYYVSPGIFGNRTQLWLLDMIRDGAHELLVNAGVPVLAAKDKETTPLALNATNARNAIIAAHELWKK